MIGVGSLVLAPSPTAPASATATLLCSAAIFVAPAPLLPSSHVWLNYRICERLNIAGLWMVSRKKFAVSREECGKLMAFADGGSSRIWQNMVDLRLKRSSECSGYAQALILAGAYVLLQLNNFFSRRNILKELRFEKLTIWDWQYSCTYAENTTLKFAAIFVHAMNHITFHSKEDTSARVSRFFTNHLLGIFVFPHKLQRIAGPVHTPFINIKACSDATDQDMSDLIKASKKNQTDTSSEKGQDDGSCCDTAKILNIHESDISLETQDLSRYKGAKISNDEQTNIKELHKESSEQNSSLLSYNSSKSEFESPQEKNMDALPSSANLDGRGLDKGYSLLQRVESNFNTVSNLSQESLDINKYATRSQLHESMGDSMWIKQVEDSGGTNTSIDASGGNLNGYRKGGSSLKMVKPTLKREKVFFPEEETGVPMELVYSSDEEKALSTLDKEARLESSLKQKLLTIRQMADAGSFYEARNLCQQLLERFPGNPRILVQYAHVERKYGSLVAARALFSDAVLAFRALRDFTSEYIRALQVWGSLEVKAKDFIKARHLFMEAFHGAQKMELPSPQNSLVTSVYGLHSWAMLEEKLGNWSKARELLERATTIQPGNAVVHQSRALLEARAHNYSTARSCFRLAVNSAPDDVKCWQAWALFEASQAKPRKMRQLFKRALSVDPKNLHSLQAWAHQESLLGTNTSRESARNLYKKCTEIDPKNLFSWQSWAILERDSGNVREARSLFEKALAVSPSSVPCLQAYAYTERMSGNLQAARRLLRKALVIEPENAAVLMVCLLVLHYSITSYMFMSNPFWMR
ncbi:hypothetical protein O6H91_09G090900 [Diphasiastrum complanatum]|uniref:Uncharacterized protein n=3 Tax=Diphasiastrum complanatum TaxID=34168 RepID=A0ACC2CRQ4_DIPCM|nr:hypothetical protein O6H91_09G090900 [Diphasiastrum complanatum]KAJ7544725.1 hypothetical protein O6H91_09G090900 [Diphasiastrum complanatum]KAJ7544726.1 hypothetical protein O6H91_09G090900 [Diphasiastrum complanatum]